MLNNLVSENVDDFCIELNSESKNSLKKYYQELNHYDHHFIKLINKDTNVRQWFQSFCFDSRLRALTLPRSYSVLKFVHQHVYSHQLFKDVPILFALLVDYAHSNQLSDDEFIALVSLKRSDVLQLIFDGVLKQPKQALKFLSKVDYKKLSCSDFNVIKQSLKSNMYLGFAHNAVLTVSFLQVMSRHEFLKQNKWLINLSDAVLINQTMYQITQFLNSVAEYGLTPIIQKRLNSINNWDDLIDWIKRYKEMYKLMSMYRKAVANSNGIHHSNIQLIDNVFDLYEQGEMQNNCVFDYVDEIVSGGYRIYKVMVTKLATLGAYVSKSGYLEVDQLLTTNNEKVDKETKNTVFEWVNLYNQGIAFGNGHRLSNYSIYLQHKNQHIALNQPRDAGIPI
jgi:hypothetical protein